MPRLAHVYEYLRLMRVDRPIGFFLVLWPTWWALWLANGGLPPLKLLLVFTLGVFLMRSAGCVINDIADRNIDPAVKRTQDRPLAAGTISLRAAIIVFAVLLALAASLLLWLNPLCSLLAIVAALLAGIYPFCKRFFALPQLILGMAFAMSVPMAFAATLNQLPWQCWWLFIAVLIWTFVYDTFYALADIEDDRKLGIHSSALSLGKTTLLITAIGQLLVILMLYAIGIFFQLHWLYRVFVFFGLILFLYQQQLARQNDPQQAFKAFLNNNAFGMILFLGIFVGNYLR